MKFHILLSAGLIIWTSSGSAQNLPETHGPVTGYATVDEALAALHARPDVKFTEQGGWTIANDETNMAFWSFSPKGYPAYPAAVKRHLVQSKDGWNVEMSIMCNGTKSACDQLVLDFEKLNEAMRQYLSQRH